MAGRLEGGKGLLRNPSMSYCSVQGINRLYKEIENWPEYLKSLEKLAELYAAR